MTGVVLVLLLLIGRCSMGMAKAWKLADAAVADFHQKLDAEDYHSIYVSSDPAFQQSGSEQQMNEFLGAVHQKLGAVQEAKKTNLFLNTTTSGTFARVTYQTRFASATATETFTWRMSLNGMKLVGYNIDSRELVTK